MMIKKTLLAAVAVIGLAAPAIASAHDFGGYGDGYGRGYGYRDGYARQAYEHPRFFAWRRYEREREFRHHLWRSYEGRGDYGWRH